MRPLLLAGCLGTLWFCGLAHAQTSDQRPSNMRDAAVVTRATPPTALGGNSAEHSTINPTAPSFPPNSPNNFPPMPGASSASTGMSDQAWTSPPQTSRASARLSDSPPAGPSPMNSSPVSSSPVSSSSVVPAQFTASSPAGNHNATAPLPTANATRAMTGSATGSTHEPRPLKPPTAPDAKASGSGSTGTVQMFVSVLSSLAIVIGLILASAWFYRKAAPTIHGALPKQVVQVLGRTPLAPRQQLVLLRLGSKLVLVSNLHGDVRTISEITDPLEVDRLAGMCEATQPGSISESFRSVLHNIGRNG